MAWIESHENLGEHPKLKELCFQLMVKPYEGIGHLTLLWHFTLKYAWRDGDLRRFSARVICEAVGWDKDADTFINALRETGWLEKDSFVIHDWMVYAGKLVRDRRYQEDRRLISRKSDEKRRKAIKTENRALPNPTLPNPTLPNQSIKDIVTKQRIASKPKDAEEVTGYAKSIGFLLDGQQFLDYYASKGWVVGHSPMKDWKAAVRTWKRNGFNQGGQNAGIKPSTSSLDKLLARENAESD